MDSSTLLVSLLKGRNLPHVAIQVLEDGERSWFTAGVLNRSVAHPGNDDSLLIEDYGCDLDMLLQPFCRLRNARSLRLDIPFPDEVTTDEEDRIGDLYYVVDLMKAAAISSLPFGRKSPRPAWIIGDDGEKYIFEDDIVATNENDWSLWLDQSLDEMKDPTSRFLRLERFAHWSCGHYEAFAHQTRYIDGTPRTSKHSCFNTEISDSASERAHAILAFEPKTCTSSKCTRQLWLESYSNLGIPSKYSGNYEDIMDLYWRKTDTRNNFRPKYLSWSWSRSKSIESFES